MALTRPSNTWQRSKKSLPFWNRGDLRVYEKELEDGSHAVGFFNLSTKKTELAFNEFSALKLSGSQTVRDLWRQQDIAKLDTAKDSLPLTIPAHGVVLYKFSKVK